MPNTHSTRVDFAGAKDSPNYPDFLDIQIKSFQDFFQLETKSNERIEEYCKIFHPDLKGLTHKSNNNEDLKNTLKKFKIHVSKILLTEEEEEEDMKSLKEHAP